jgi:hypothetical protein
MAGRVMDAHLSPIKTLRDSGAFGLVCCRVSSLQFFFGDGCFSSSVTSDRSTGLSPLKEKCIGQLFPGHHTPHLTRSVRRTGGYVLTPLPEMCVPVTFLPHNGMAPQLCKGKQFRSLLTPVPALALTPVHPSPILLSGIFLRPAFHRRWFPEGFPDTASK